MRAVMVSAVKVSAKVQLRLADSVCRLVIPTRYPFYSSLNRFLD